MNIKEAKKIALADIKYEAFAEERRRAESDRNAVFVWMDNMTPEERTQWAAFHEKIAGVLGKPELQTADAATICAALDAALAPQKDSMRWTYKGALSGAAREARGWEGLLRWLQEFTHEGEKRAAAVFAPFAGDEASCIVLDHDGVPGWAFEQHMEELRKMFLDAVVYTTHGHGKTSEGEGHAYAPSKGENVAYFRTVVRLSRPVNYEEYEALCHYFAGHLPARADRRCFDKERVFFAPSYPPERKEKHLFKVFQGFPYDVDVHFSEGR